MTPEHTDRDLRERIEAEVEWLRNTAAGLKVEPTQRDFASGMEKAADRLAALTASEGERDRTIGELEARAQKAERLAEAADQRSAYAEERLQSVGRWVQRRAQFEFVTGRGAHHAQAFTEVADYIEDLLAEESLPSEGPRCPTCGSDDPAHRRKVPTFNESAQYIGLLRCTDPFHGIEASEQGKEGDAHERSATDSSDASRSGAHATTPPVGSDAGGESGGIEASEGESEVRELRELLREALDEYADHQSWRCGHPDRYPLDEVDPPDCPCGLHRFSIRARRALAPDPEGGTDG